MDERTDRHKDVQRETITPHHYHGYRKKNLNTSFIWRTGISNKPNSSSVGTPYFSSCSSVVGVLALPTVSAVTVSSGLSGSSSFASIDWNLLNVSGGIPLFSDIIL